MILSREIVFVGISFLLGAATASFVTFDYSVVLFGFLLSLALFLIRRAAGDRRLFLLAALLILGFSLGIARVSLFAPDRHELDFTLGQLTKFSGRVVGEPSQHDATQTLLIKLDQYHSRINVMTDRYPRYQPGDYLTITGRLTVPKSFKDESDRTVDYPAILAREGIYYQIFRPTISKVDSLGGLGISRGLSKVKRGSLGVIDHLLPDPESAYLSGILLGDKQGLGADWQNYFKQAGLSHVLVLSGYNVTIVGSALLHFLAFLPFWGGSLVTALGLIFFALLTGGGASIWRAVGMALVAIFARLSGRLYDATVALVAVAVIMVVINPFVLVFDLGFQLSFLATLGLVYFSPLLERYGYWLPTRGGIREAFVSSISAQLLVLPLLLYKTGLLSLVALPLNLIILPLQPLSMLLGGLLLGIGLLSPLLALIITYPTYLFLHLQLWLIKTGALLPGATSTISSFPLTLLLLIYLLIGFWWWRLKRQMPRVIEP